ncbi:MAG TPA: hypothetical protein V6C81_01330 [Planktothrix sp.]|jgi:hypothetical protein
MATFARFSTVLGFAVSIAMAGSAGCVAASATPEVGDDPQTEAQSASEIQFPVAAPTLQKAHVELDDIPADACEKTIAELTTAALNQNVDVLRAQAVVAHFKNKKAMLKQRADDALNSVFMFKGVSLSSEAGDVILDEKLKIDSLGAANYYKQQVQDELEMKVLATFLQTASTIGDTRSTPEDIQQSEKQLSDLVGGGAAEKAVAQLRDMPARSLREYTAHDINVLGNLQRSMSALQAAAKKDPIVEEIKTEVHSFNQHSQVVMGLHRLVRVSLSVASLAPNVVGPASQAVLFGYVVLSGGSEQSKVFKELYMDKRLDCRAATLREEVHLAFDNYKTGLLTHNSLLMASSMGVLSRLTSPTMAADLVRPDYVVNLQVAAEKADLPKVKGFEDKQTPKSAKIDIAASKPISAFANTADTVKPANASTEVSPETGDGGGADDLQPQSSFR